MNKEESNLVKHAKHELALIGAFDEEKDFYGGLTGKAVLELIQVFADQDHSGMSANIVRQMFNKLAAYKLLSPLTFKDDEWIEPGEEWGASSSYQNKRNSAVFKEGKDARPYFIHAYTMVNANTGTSWGGSLDLEGGRRVRRCYIKDPKEMPTVKIEIPVESTGPEASDWEFLPLPEEKLEELKKYYDLDIVEKEEK